jgi:hemerythrin-like domain-containing protein
MTPTEILKHEHQVILRVLDAAVSEADAIRRGGRVDASRLTKFVDFFRGFADACHHAKEEKLLFVKMEERGMPRQGGPIAVMLHEHDLGRARVRAVAGAIEAAASGDAAASRAVAEDLTAFADLLRAHIGKEDDILYPMADRILTAADQQALAAGFDRVESEEMGAGTHERFHALAHELIGEGTAR